MLEKNKDYVEMRVSSTDCAFTQNEPTSICIDGYVYTSYMNLPDPGELYILISKEKFEKLQANAGINAELARQWEINYDLLLKKTGFDTVEELVNYIYDNGPNSQMNWETLKEIIDDAEEDYISERDKAEELQKENEQLKKKLEEKTAEADDPLPDFRELLKKLYSTNDVENLEWTLNHVCGGRGSVNGWIAVSSFWKQKYETLSKLVGFVTVEELQDYLTNEAECDTLQEAILKFIKENKYACEKWCNANSSNNSWKAAAECNSPKELIEKIKGFRDEIGIYSRALKDWKEETGCPSPSAAKTMIESQASWCHAYNEVKEKNEKLGESIKQWQEATGYETPEKAMEHLSKLRNEGTHIVYLNDPLGVIAKWEKVTGYDKPKNFLKWKANIEGIVESWKSETGCKYPGEAGRLLEKWQTMTKCETPEAAATWITSYESACERGNRLAEEVEEWKKATGCETPVGAEERIKYYKSRLGNAIQAASCAAKHLDNITF